MSKFFILFYLFFLQYSYSQNRENTSQLDTILSLRRESKNSNLDLSQRIALANKAITLSKKTGVDTTLLKSKKNLSSLYLNERDYESLKTLNFDILNLATNMRDTSSMANASFILGFIYHEKFVLDSAYYHYFKATKFYDSAGEVNKSIDVLSNMADIQHAERDYIGSEINAIRAIKKLERLPQNKKNLSYLWSMHNLIGIVSGELKNYDKAIEEYKKSLTYIKKLDNSYFYNIYSQNNIASVYIKKGDYETAIKRLSELLRDKDLKTIDSSSYVSVLGNLAYSKFLNGDDDYNEIYDAFQKSISVSKHLDNPLFTMSNSTYFSEFLKEQNKIDSAIHYANLAYAIAKQTNTNNFILKTLKLKASLIKDSSSIFLNEHIKLNDSLINAERSIRNKFARIDRETETFKQQKEVVSRQNILLLVASSVLAITLLLFYVIKTRREKIKELQLAQQQQQANEEIYNLMLSQQDKMDEAKALEKKRISQEIHDGILGRLFGVRLNLDSLNFVKTDDAITSRSNYINELKEIEFDIRKVSHDLNTDFVSNSSFSDIMNTLVETQCEAYGIECSTSISKSINWDMISNKTKVHIYRITQESLQNIYKHAEASLVTIIINEDNNLLSLAIVDNGKGFENDRIKDGIGLKNIKSRVEEINAKFNIKTNKNEGTTVEIEVPT